MKSKFLFLLFVFSTFQSVFAFQSIGVQPLNLDANVSTYSDYSSYPPRDFSYKQAKIEYKYDEENGLLLGKVAYEIEALINTSNTIKMLAFRMQIDEVVVDNELASYSLQNDTLSIALTKNAKNKNIKLEIIFETDLKYGLHKDRFGTVWTSNQPYSVAHYLPGFIHPRNKFLIDVSFETTQAFSVAAPGRLIKESTVSDKSKLTQWKTETPISITDFKFAIGRFQKEEVQIGVKKIRIFAHESIYSKQEMNELLLSAYDVLRFSETTLNQEYPYQSLSVVCLAESRWETKTYSASIGFVYKTIGDSKLQINRIVFSQWFGALKQSELIKNANYDVYWQSWMQNKLYPVSSESISDTLQFPYSFTEYFDYSAMFSDSTNQLWLNTFEKSTENHLTIKKNILQPKDYIDVLYKESGRVFEGLSKRKEIKPVELSAEIEIDFAEGDKQFKTIVHRKNGSNMGLTNAEVILVTPKSRLVKKITLQAETDTLTLDAPVGLKNVYVTIPGVTQINYIKPNSFWLTQLREEKISESRYSAAVALASDSTNPDLQLIIYDLLKNESNSTIKAKLIEVYASLTKGATGTDAYFLEQFRSKEMPIKFAALQAFKWFPKNESMILNAQALLKNDLSQQNREEVIAVLEKIMQADLFVDYLKKQLKSTKSSSLTLSILTKLSQHELTQNVDSLLLSYTLVNYPFQIRSFAIENWINEHQDIDEVKVEISKWISDSDPRIRYVILNNFNRFDSETQSHFLAEMLNDDYDFRIKKAALQKINQLNKTSN